MTECNSKCGSCESSASCDLKLKNRLSAIKHKVMVLSGKGGVGEKFCISKPRGCVGNGWHESRLA